MHRKCIVTVLWFSVIFDARDDTVLPRARHIQVGWLKIHDDSRNTLLNSRHHMVPS